MAEPHHNPPLQRNNGGQIREAIDRLEGPCRRRPETRVLQIFDRLRNHQRQAPHRHPGGQELQVHDPRERIAALKRC
jgi:hypothetical protein